MTTAFIIRLHYEKDDPRFAWRFAYFRDKVLPRILAQKGDFDIAIRCNPAHDRMIEDLHGRIRTFHVRDEFAAYKGGRYFYDFVPFDRCEGLAAYDLQLGLDSDDLIEPEYLDLVRAYVRDAGDRPIHICFQPELLDVRDGSVHPIPQKYTSEKGSAFFALYQPHPRKIPFVFAYQESHLTIGRHFPHSVVAPAGYAFASCHDLNESTHL